MRKILFGILLSVAVCSHAHAQSSSFPKAEVFGGYSYANIDTNGLSPRQSANGWNASVVGNFNRYFGVEGDVAGYYKTYDFNVIIPQLVVNVHVNVHDYSYFAGPRFTYGPIFVHAMLGGDHLTGSAFGLSASQDSLAGAFGGGVEWPVHRNWAFRASGDYVFTRHDLLGITSFTQNNFRASAGVVYRFGGNGKEARKKQIAQPGEPSPAPERPPMPSATEVALIGVSGYASDIGFRITAVRNGSAADQVFLKRGDVISTIDGHEVHSSKDIDVAIGANTTGTIKVRCLVQTAALGLVASEKTIKIR